MLLDAKQLDPKFELWYKEFMSTKFPTVKSVEINIPASDLKYEKKDTGVRVEVPINSTMENIVLPATAHVKFVNAPEKDVNIYWNSIDRFDGESMEEQNFFFTLEYGNYVPGNVSIPMMTIQAKDLRSPKSYYRYMLKECSEKNTDPTHNYKKMTVVPSDVISKMTSESKTTYATDAKEMFYICSALTELPNVNIDFSKATDITNMFYSCQKIKNIPDQYLNLPSVTKAQDAFHGISVDYINFDKLILDSLVDTTGLMNSFSWQSFSGQLVLKSALNVYHLLSNGKYQGTFPMVILPSVTSLAGIAGGCSCAIFEGIDAPKATNCSEMFYKASIVNEIKTLNLPSATNFSNAFYQCLHLRSLPVLDMSHVTEVNNMLYRCNELTEVHFANVPVSLKSKLTRETLDSSGESSFNIVIDNVI